MKTQSLVLLLAILPFLAPAASAADLVPFVIPAVPLDKSLIAAPAAEALRPGGPRIVARDGHFYLGDRRYRVWGVNLCFGANLPTHDDARNVAARLAAAGVNSVRLHHMDNTSFPRGIWDAKDPMKLSDEGLDRLDYFVDQLAARGVTVNLNLHVSRTHSRHVPGLPPVNTSYDKIVGIFTPVLIDAQKKYARDMLTHVNAYRKVRYADDPAIAFVEITNEDSLFMWSAAHDLPDLPELYAGVLRARFAQWLQKRYGSTDALRKAWSAGAEPLGANVLADLAFDMKPPKDPNQPRWEMELHEGCKAAATKGKEPNSVRIEIAQANATGWHIQFKQPHLTVRKGRYYTVTLRARADKPRKIACGVSQAHEPWGNLGLSRTLDLTGTWRGVRMGFVATADDQDARLIFSVGGETTGVELADLAMCPGGQVGLREGESIEAANVAVFADSEVERRIADRWEFLTETEKGYFDDMRNYIHKDLGCAAPVTGTIVFGPCGLYGQADMDFIDVHSYWLHPRFPGRPWDAANWIVEQRAMTDNPAGATLWDLGACRLAGAPFTCSEYNHPAPNDYQAECVPMIAAFAAAQDWDGIWLFAYCHRTNDWDRGSFASFFDIDTNPAKWGFMRAGAAIFRDAALPPLPPARTLPLAPDGRALPAVVQLHRTYDRNMERIFADKLDTRWSDMLTDRLYVTLGGSGATAARAAGAADTRLSWSVDSSKRGQFSARSSRAIVETGWWLAGGEATFGAVTVTPLDGKPIGESAAVLIAACGRCENTGMEFSPDRRTVGRNWGGAPVLIEPLARQIKLPIQAGEARRLQPLGPDGTAMGQPVQIKVGPDGAIQVSPEHRTMWYLLTRP